MGEILVKTTNLISLSLNLQNNKLTDKGFLVLSLGLSKLIKLKSLELCLNSNFITDKSGENLGKVL